MVKIALVGQANVGKSTLFNRLISQSKAITSDIPGTTRDRNYGICEWQGEEITFIDTGGVWEDTDDFKEEVVRHINIAIQESDFIFFILEIKSPDVPISNLEREISRLIKKSKKSCFLVLNKADNPAKREWGLSEHWLKMGAGKPFCLSAINGSGVGDLLDYVTDQIKEKSLISIDESEEKLPLIKVAIIGKPNVGKSTLLNSLLGEEKVIVSSQPHTTRGPQDSLLSVGDNDFLLIDTAGIRRRARINAVIEKIGVRRSMATIERSDIILMVIDISSPLSHQDKALIDLIIGKDKGLIFVINKCDLAPRQKFKREDFDLSFASWAPAIFVSAKKGKNVQEIFSLIVRVQKNCFRRMTELKLNEFLRSVVRRKKLPADIWSKVHAQQVDVCPPNFLFLAPTIVLKRKSINAAQINIMEKALRKRWDFAGTSVKITLTDKSGTRVLGG